MLYSFIILFVPLKVSITLEPSVEEFEEQLLIDLNRDRLVKNDIVPDDGLNVKIIERRLKVSFI